MNMPSNATDTLRRLITVPHVAAASFLLLTLATAGRYGFFGDELYYFACSKHLDFGYVDHPPLVALLTLVGTWIFGETVIGLRFLSGLAGAVTVVLAAHIARSLGGGKFSQSFASLSICFAGAFPALSSFFSMNPVDVTLCTLFVYLFLRTIAAPSPKQWITVGIVFGIGAMNKYTFFILGLSLLLSFIVTRRWDIMKSSWMYVAGVVSFVIVLPHLIWQIQHGWPTLEFMYNATEYKNLSVSPLEFFSQLTIGLNPFLLPLWLGGLIFLLFDKEMKEHRYLGWMVVVFLLVYLFQKSKFYYVLPAFPLVLSSGAVALERLMLRYRVTWPKWVMGTTMVLSGTALMPLAVPILSPDLFITYSKALGLWDAIRMEKGEGDTLPLHFVHRFGWEELTESVKKAYDALPAADKDSCAILASWYGIAGAIDHFGPERSLPNAICPRNSYWYWGPRGYSGDVVLAVGYDAHSLQEMFDSVEHVVHFENRYAYDVEIYVCRKPKLTLIEMWPRLKRFI